MANQNFLSKTDFKLARQCPTKLYYHRKGYASSLDQNDYLELLKEGGYMIGEMARLLYPEGVYVGGEREDSLSITAELLKKENVVLFEAPVMADGMYAVIDIIEKCGSQINLIEVKSKSYDSREESSIIGKSGKILAAWQEYIEDVTFQSLVFNAAYPQFSIVEYLMLPDKSKRTSIDLLASYFNIEKSCKDGVEKFQVNFTGDRELVAKDSFLKKINISEACSFLRPLVSKEARQFADMLNPELVKIQYHLGKHCKDCEFRSEEPSASGFHECWKELADVKPHIFDLYYGGAIKKDGKFLFDVMVAEKKASLYDIPAELIKGVRGERQNVQIAYTKSNKEWINPAFRQQLESLRYPLHFIDFETSTSAIPYHKDMRPYETIAFQWSCHTVNAPGEAPVHSEWINLEDSFPSFKFAEALMSTLSPNGSIFMWANHENSVLAGIRRQMLDYNYKNDELKSWLDSMIKDDSSEGRLIDMNELCKAHYFHPAMRGKTSVKYVLPAIWNNNSYLWEIPFLSKFYSKQAGSVVSPYSTLPPIEIEGIEQTVKEGTGAMVAYQEMMFGLSKSNPQNKRLWSQLLLQYCELDTLAMLIVFIHWKRLLNIAN